MPIGLVIMRWNERRGAELVGKYPPEVQVTEKTMMQIYSAHEYSDEAGMISITVGAVNVASYTTGTKTGYYINLLLNVDEDSDAYEGGLADVTRVILANAEDNGFLPLLPSLFQRLSVYPTLRSEQKLAMLLADGVKLMVLKRLQEEGVIFKSELGVWLKDVYRTGFVDLDSVISSLIKEGLAKSATIESVQSELIFLINDIVIARRPPTLLLKECTRRGLPATLRKDYVDRIKTYFQQYIPSENDFNAIVEAFSDPAVYETLTLLRSAIATRDDLEKLKKKGVDDVEKVLKILYEQQMLEVFRDDAGNEYFGLKSDVLLEKIYPSYLLNVIRKSYTEKSKAKPVLLEYLNILEETHQGITATLNVNRSKKK